MNHPTNTLKTVIRLLTFSVALLTAGIIHGQTNGKSQPVDNNIHLKVYYQSAAIGDANMAISALHYLVASDPVKYGNWLDTIATLYTQINSYQQAYLLANALLNTRGYTDLRMEIKALCAKALQQPAEAIAAYSALFNKTHNPAYGFEQLQLQFAIKRMAETVVTANTLLPLLTDKAPKVSVSKLDGKSAQQVSMKAAVLNILGLTYMDLKDKENALAQFEAAVKESPDFELAKSNLETTKTIGENAANKK